MRVNIMGRNIVFGNLVRCPFSLTGSVKYTLKKTETKVSSHYFHATQRGAHTALFSIPT